ncbi:MAG: DNA polymerase III subunit delta [Gemmobacter sp.]
MKLSPAEAARVFARPDPGMSALLIHGEDAMRVALRRQQVIAALIGPEGEAEMRLVRLSGPDLRRDAARLVDSVKERGFFPGPRVVFVEDAGDALTDAAAAALEDWQPGDAALIVTAAALPAKSSLRKLFEGHRAALCTAIYDDPPSRAEIVAALDAAGLRTLADDGRAAVEALARTLDPGDFRQTLDKIALYKHGDPAPLTAAEVALCAPDSSEAGIDEVLDAAAEGQAEAIGPLMRRLEGQGVRPVRICIDALRHFRALHSAAVDPAGAARLRLPVFGPRRDRLIRQAQGWGSRRLDEALALILDCDLTLRSVSRAPDSALVERMLIRLARLRR